MAVKPPRGGGTHVDVDVQINTTRPIDGSTSKPDVPGRVSLDPWGSVESQKPRVSPPGDADLDAILPAPTVTVQQTPLPTEMRSGVRQPLESYWISTAAQLPEADSEGFRLYKTRKYVDVLDGGTVLVGVDPDTGRYRARLSNELLPSGPVLLREVDSGLWRPLNEINANSVPLTDASLHAFRTGLDFNGVEPGSDGLVRHDGKLYLVFHEHAYQVMHDLDASSPAYKVWRIVNPEDPVATDSANIYRASRSGETRAITRNDMNTWVSIFVGLRGGMHRNEPAQANIANLHRPWLTRPSGPPGGQPAVVIATTRAQVKSYFPEATDLHADDFIAHFGNRDAAEVELKRLQLEFPQLNREVTAWEVSYKGNDSTERSRRTEIAGKIRRLYKWQAEPSEKVYRDGQLVGFKLEMNLGSRANLKPPAFSKRLDSVVALSLTGKAVLKLDDLFSTFSHVESLEVRALGGTGKELLGAINKLTELKILEIHQTQLWPQPGRITDFTGLPRLQELSLTNCHVWHNVSVRGMTELRVLRIRSTGLMWLPEGLTDLPGPSRLQVLDLFHNPEIRVAPDLTHMSELRVLDMSHTRINLPPAGLGSQSGPLRLEVLNFADCPLVVAPSLRGMTALREVDLSRTQINRFPEGVTSEIPKTSLNMVYSRIVSIPETIELRKGFELRGTPITDPASLRRLIAARRQTGTDIWLGIFLNDLGINHWLHNVPQAQQSGKFALWNSLNSQANSTMMEQIRHLVRTPEFQVERQLLQRRVWSFLERFEKASLGEQGSLLEIAATEPSPGKMLERLEEEIRKFDHTWQNQPPHHLPKRPKLE
ncbi:hypothetical protein IAI51_13100 [Pseudomonas sp. N40(2020)]|uniref:leucine-rich repeat domain-containing protein n=1 Tax=Pseudomonas sp. N40(2020) TaxID=2767798 RepID=UPI001656EAAC|nr:hypothetical protein [Pseudomonas sp. N40(2020)]MBC8997468.1 hypothetical protein [Pseudomonas sp. N40(2020)]